MDFLEIFTAGPYNVALTGAIVTGLVLAIRAGHAAGHPRFAWIVLIVAGVTSGLIGSKFIFFDFQPPEYGEKSNLGGIVLGVGTVLVLARALGLGALRSLDTLAVPTLAGMAIGRVGCFLAGCCKGTETLLPWGVHYEGDLHAVHPVQLYEAGADVLLIAALMRRVPSRTAGGRFGAAVVGYAGIRLLTEFVRGGREIVAGLNPVQWSMLAIGTAVALWLLRRTQHAAVPVPVPVMVTVVRCDAPRSERRAFAAALGVAAVLMALTLGAAPWFTPLERVTLVAAAAGVAMYAVARRVPRGATWRLAPSLGAVVLLQAPQPDDPPRRELVVGGSFWRGAYSRVVGSRTEMQPDLCDGSPQQVTVPTMADRETGAQTVSIGLRQRLSSGSRVMFEGQVVTGRDRVRSVESGPLDAPVGDVRIRAAGAAATIEGRDAELQLGVLAGSMSQFGQRQDSHGAFTATARLGTETGFFLEGHYSNPQLYSTLGDFSHAGVGLKFGAGGGRAVFGLGHGTYVGIHVPIKGFEIDIALREADGSLPYGARTKAIRTIGVRRGFAIGK